MTKLLHDLLTVSAQRRPDATAVRIKGHNVNYADLANLTASAANGLLQAGLRRQDRVAIYLPKRLETVAAIFATTMAGGVFVPVNPLLKPAQVGHILRDCAARIMVTTGQRMSELVTVIRDCVDLRTIILVDSPPTDQIESDKTTIDWRELLTSATHVNSPVIIDVDMASIIYTSGSTGRPKGVVLSHRNLITGAESVAQYLENSENDRLLALLPLSFDYGFSQLTTAFNVGASVVLMDYLLPRDVLHLVVRERITGLAAVPPVWIQLADLDWPSSVTGHLRYFTNSGGAMPGATLAKLRTAWPGVRPYLMYGLTEAFRATYLPPDEVDRRPDSIGRAIPNAEVMVVRPDGTRCAPHEPGELVQRGSLVAMGYWNNPPATAERFRAAPGQPIELPLVELAVWSGDSAKMDEDGYLYFIGRKDEMIKTSGYRVSPTEIEEAAYGSGLVTDAVALGATHLTLGQGIVLVVSPAGGEPLAAGLTGELLEYLKSSLPNFMVPQRVVWLTELPRNPNGKFDRSGLASQYRDILRDELQ